MSKSPKPVFMVLERSLWLMIIVDAAVVDNSRVRTLVACYLIGWLLVISTGRRGLEKKRKGLSHATPKPNHNER